MVVKIRGCTRHRYPAHASLEDHLARRADNTLRDQWLLVDGITNPQNLGMMIRSTAASPLQGIIIPQKGNASLDPLAIKASAGTLFRATILRTPDIEALYRHSNSMIINWLASLATAHSRYPTCR